MGLHGTAKNKVTALQNKAQDFDELSVRLDEAHVQLAAARPATAEQERDEQHELLAKLEEAIRLLAGAEQHFIRQL